ncbi:MAG: bifunctional nuclease domain-containing protein [Bacteroidales bacterium]
MKKIRLEIKSISFSNSPSGAYVIVLDNANHTKRLPIVIGNFEARSIAFKIENIKPQRPLTHDIFVSFAESFNINLIEVIICKFEEGIFYSKLVFENEGTIKEIDARTSDAIALSLRFNSPIYIYDDILDIAGIDIDEETEEENLNDSSDNDNSEFEQYTINELKEILDQSIRDEEYEKASKIRDEIKKREQY